MSFNLKQKYWVSVCTLLLSCGTSFAQIGSVSDQNYFKNFLGTIGVGGYYRGFFYGRDMKVPYSINQQETKVLSATDPVYFDPMVSLYITATPSPTSSIGLDLNIINFLSGPVLNSSGYLNNWNAMVLRGNFELKGVGKFNAILGGIEFTRITPFTFGANVGYNRYSVFDRRPWDGGGNVKSKYADYYYKGSFVQDARFGTQAYKGLIISGYFAKKVNVDFFYGKASTLGGAAQTDVSRPKHDVALKVSKGLGKGNWVSLSTFNTIIQTDSINITNPQRAQMVNVITASEDFTIKGININSEIGAGAYQSPNFAQKWSPAILTDIAIPKKLTYIPLMFRFYYVGKNYVNRNSYVSNTTIPEANQVYGQTNAIVGANGAVLLPVNEQLIGVGTIANNRIGGNINTELDFGPLKVMLGNEMAVDIDRMPENTSLSYTHRVNSLQWSRFPGVFPNPYGNFGPNARVNSIYRSVYEVAAISDTNSAGNLRQKLAHNSADVQLKWHNKIAGRDFYVYWLNTFSSIGTEISPLPVMTNKAYINALYSEFEFYYNVHRLVTWSMYFGLERVHGNKYTKASSLPVGQAPTPSDMKYRNQTGKAIGTGFDFQLNNSTNLYFRYRWFSYADKSNATEKFKGHEATIELKVFF